MRTSVRATFLLPGVLLLAACCSKPPELPCAEFAAGSPEAAYCDTYALAVSTYLREPDAVPERIIRYRQFQAFVPSIEGLAGVVEIDAAIRTATTIPGFLTWYTPKHGQAQAQPITSPQGKRTLLLSGFRRGLEAFRQEHSL